MLVKWSRDAQRDLAAKPAVKAAVSVLSHLTQRHLASSYRIYGQ